jgi:hypothetical protein
VKGSTPLPVGAVGREVVRVYGRHWTWLVPAAIVILLPQAIIDGFLDGLSVEGVHSFRDALTLGLIPLTVAVGLGGEALYAGFAAAAVIEWRAGHPVPRPRHMWAALPLGTLIALDLVLSFGAALGLLLLVVPSFVFLAYYGISPALVKIEHLGVWESMRRSAALVRGNFWHVMVVIVGLVVFTELATQAITFPFHGQGHGLVSVIDLAVEGLLEPFQALATVIVAVRLLEMRGELPPPEEMAFVPAASA